MHFYLQWVQLDYQLDNMDFNNPGTYDFAFEIGLKPNFEIKTKDIKVKRYKVAVTDVMIQNEVDRIQTRNGKMTEPATADTEENVLNVRKLLHGRGKINLHVDYIKENHKLNLL